MERLKRNDKVTLEKIFQLSQNSLMNTMYGFLCNKYNQVVRQKDYIYAIGNIPITLIAHCDTVFSELPKNIFYDEEKNVMWSPTGLGADDRAGIWAIIKIVRTGLLPHIILTADEEMGGLGASKLIEDCPFSFADMKYIIELDRRGSCDCVFYDCNNPSFVNYVEHFGFCENWGSFSDISIICPKWKIAGVNLSIGYEDEHSIAETLWIGIMYKTIDKVIKMLKDAKNAEYFEYIPNTYKKKWYLNNQGNDLISDYFFECVKCKKTFNEYEVFPAKMANGETQWVCCDCMMNFAFCEKCQEAYELTEDYTNNIVCPDCVKILINGSSF